MKRVNGKVAIVTGGSSGIGAATASLLAEEGASIVITGRNEERGQATVDQIAENGGEAVFIQQDVTNEAAWPQVICTVTDRYGRLDILFNNAGVSFSKPLLDITLEDWRWMMETNVEGVFLGTKHAVMAMRRFGNGGSIINNASVYGLIGAPRETAYCASKAAVVMFSKAAALESAEARDGIRINTICAGTTWTPIFGKENPGWDQRQAEIHGAEELRREMGESIPIGFVAEPDDIARAVLYLASDESKFVTASNLVIDGGTTAR